MPGFTFIHAADVHLDSPLLGLERYDGAPLEAMRQATRQALQNLVRATIDEGAAFLILAGDVFDGDWRDYNTGVFFNQQMAALERRSIPVFVLQGNHDAQAHMTRALRLPANVRVFSSAAPETLTLDALRVALHGRSFAEREVKSNLASSYPAPVSGCLNIGVLHTAMEGREGHASYAPCSIADLVGKGYDYWALGHVHQREVICERPWIVFPGNIQGRHARETGAKGCTVVTVEDGAIARVRERALDVVRWVSIDCDASGLETPEDVVDRLAERIAAEVSAAEGRLLAARVRARGRTAAASMRAEPDRWRAELVSRVASLAGGRAWIEKMVLDLDTPRAIEAAASESVAVLEGILSDLGARGVDAPPEFARDLQKKLGIHAPSGEDSPLAPQALRRARDEAVELLRLRLRAAGAGRRA